MTSEDALLLNRMDGRGLCGGALEEDKTLSRVTLGRMFQVDHSLFVVWDR